MQYDVIFACSLAVLVASVNENIEAGWQPIGGISVTEVRTQGEFGTSRATSFYQAMVRPPFADCKKW